jgi:hypothetical protein
MVSKFIVRSILTVTLVFFMGTTARATISGTSTTQTKCTTQLHLAGLCSIQVEGLLKGLGNVTKNPTAFTATVLIQAGSIFCKNPASKSLEGNGVPFSELSIELEGADLIDANQVSKNGKALSDIGFHDGELIAAIEDALTTACSEGDQGACDTLAQLPCQHSNWIQTVVVTKLQVLGEQFTDPDTTTPTCDLNSDPLIIDPDSCTLVDALGTKCDAPPAVVADPKAYVWQAFTYACTESCHNLPTGPICPVALPLP